MSKNDKSESQADEALEPITGTVPVMNAVGTLTLPFHSLKQGMLARVVAIHGGSSDQKRLLEMGLTVGTSFKVIKVAPFGDPVEIDLRGYRLCLRKNETENFEIEAVV
jgi:ferrous iron transport protein A